MQESISLRRSGRACEPPEHSQQLSSSLEPP
jgi:hypothetical protein